MYKRQQFTINKIVYKIFGVMSKDLYSEMCVHFGVDSLKKFGILFMSNVALIPFVLFGCIFVAFVQFLFAVFIHLFCATK